MEGTDETLAQRLQKGGEGALAELMRRYEPKLMRYGNRFLAGQGGDALRQAVQDTFIRAYTNIEGYDPNQPFSSWMYRIAHNVFVDVLRQRTKQPTFGFDFDRIFSHAEQGDSYFEEKEQEETRVLVEKALTSLAPAQREILVLYYFEELSYKEIADVLHVPIGTVGVRLKRARAALRTELPAATP